MLHELEEIKKGATWQNIYDCLWTIATVRYVTREQLAKHFPNAVWQKKIATKRKLDALAEKGFLEQSPDGVLMATRKTVRLLKDYSDRYYKIIKLPTGVGKRDSIDNTDILLKVMSLTGFHALFYPVFHENKKDDQPFLVPDGAVVFKKDNMAKLFFLEIEQPKPNWLSYLEEKKRKYELISTRPETWAEWWIAQCENLDIQPCARDEFGFQVWCIGGFLANWAGWVFRLLEGKIEVEQI